MKTNPNDYVSPSENIDHWIAAQGEKPEQVITKNGGLTKREYFAAMAMQGLSRELFLDHPEKIAEMAVIQADALIAELNKE